MAILVVLSDFLEYIPYFTLNPWGEDMTKSMLVEMLLLPKKLLPEEKVPHESPFILKNNTKNINLVVVFPSIENFITSKR